MPTPPTNNLGTLAGAIVLQRALELTFKLYPALRIISLGFKDLDGRAGTALLNQPVTSKIRGLVKVNPFGTGATDTNFTDVTLTLSNMREAHVAFGPNDYNATDLPLMDLVAQPLAEGINKYIIQSAGSNWTSANFNVITPLVVASAWSYANFLIPIRKALNNAGVPASGRFVVCNSDVYASLLQDPIIIAAFNNPANGLAIQRGELPTVAGLQILEYPDFINLPQVSGIDPMTGDAIVGGPTEPHMVAFAGTPDSTIYMSRAPKDPKEVIADLPVAGRIGYVENPTMGFAAQVHQYFEFSDLEINNRLVWLDAYGVGNPNNGLLIRSQSGS